MKFSETLIRDLNKTELKLINSLEENTNKIVNLSITETAKMFFVSPSFITKTLKKVGYYGWKDYKGFINNTITTNKASNTYGQYLETELFPSITKTFDTIDEFVLSKIVSLITEQKRDMFFIGEGFSYFICKDQNRRYNKIGKRTTALNSRDGLINSIPDGAIVFFITASGLTKSTLEAHKNIIELKRGIATILVTANPGHKGSNFTEMLVGSFQDSVSKYEREFPRFSRIIILLILDRIFLSVETKLSKKQ